MNLNPSTNKCFDDIFGYRQKHHIALDVMCNPSDSTTLTTL
jgi:hypothetical protein